MIQRLRIFMVLALGLIPFSLALASAPASAATVDLFPKAVCQDSQGQTTTVCNQKGQKVAGNKNPVVGALSITIDTLSYIVGVSAAIVIIVSGIRMVTSAGDAQSFGKARSSILYSLIALAIAIVSNIIVAFVLNGL